MPDNDNFFPLDVIASISNAIEAMKQQAQEVERELTPLMLAARAGQQDEVLALLRQGEDVNAATKTHGSTALLDAVSEHHPSIVRLLVQHGANLSGGSHGFTALHLAALLDDVACAVALLDCGADINAQASGYGGTPLMEAMSEGDGNFIGPNVARLLIERGANLALQDAQGKTVLDYALDYYNCWIDESASVWLGPSQRELIELVRQMSGAI